MKMNELFSVCLIFSLMLSFTRLEPVSCAGAAPAATSIEQQCNAEFAKVATCLNFATGKAAKPSDDCCTNIKDIRKNNPVCLCYIILQTHNGAPSLKDLGLQEDKLLELPNACKLTDASVDQCPKLLNLSPGSPDNAIFTNSTTPGTSKATPASPSSASTNSSTTKNGSPSTGFTHEASSTIVLIAAVLVFICSVFNFLV